ncbi:MAG: hypothetical protein OXE92_02700 [Bacteroidetes bacterium]|nr:hypothetical protein [Bacteroidota bacterium]MCY4204618.1 hypothetical protein [Bacteroidota bacterium]
MAETQHSPGPQPFDIVPGRGPAEYFHGRTRILRSFNELLRLAREKMAEPHF